MEKIARSAIEISGRQTKFLCRQFQKIFNENLIINKHNADLQQYLLGLVGHIYNK